jgi:HD-GYP domain-containing protein (c-di-GMP phosphodiesterase class II)
MSTPSTTEAPGREVRVDPPAPGSAWTILERLVRELQQTPQVPQQLRHTLDAVRESTRADVVFWYPPAGQGQLVLGADSRLSADGCRRFAAGLLDQAGPEEEQLLWSGGGGAGNGPVPCSAALLRVGSPHSAWLVAVSLDPGRTFAATDLELLRLARRLLLSQHQQSRLQAQFKDSLLGLVRCLTATLDAKDPCTAGHSERVARIAVLLGKHMGLSDRTVHAIFLGGLLHDIGKIGVPDAVLLKAGRLTRKEFARIQEHTLIGDRILLGVAQLAPLRPLVRSHHERYDGKGYPDGLGGDAIPPLARLLAVADGCDAMMSSRRYRPALAPPQIDALFREGAGKQWDPHLVDVFMDCRRDVYPPIYQKGLGETADHAVTDLAASYGDGSSMFLKAFVPDGEGD